MINHCTTIDCRERTLPEVHWYTTHCPIHSSNAFSNGNSFTLSFSLTLKSTSRNTSYDFYRKNCNCKRKRSHGERERVTQNNYKQWKKSEGEKLIELAWTVREFFTGNFDWVIRKRFQQRHKRQQLKMQTRFEENLLWFRRKKGEVKKEKKINKINLQSSVQWPENVNVA